VTSSWFFLSTLCYSCCIIFVLYRSPDKKYSLSYIIFGFLLCKLYYIKWGDDCELWFSKKRPGAYSKLLSQHWRT